LLLLVHLLLLFVHLLLLPLEQAAQLLLVLHDQPTEPRAWSSSRRDSWGACTTICYCCCCCCVATSMLLLLLLLLLSRW